MQGVLGILGGMGPLATVDFMQKVIEATPAQRDQDHIPMLVHSVPQVPDRTAAILANDDAPLDWMRRGAKVLTDAGAECIAIPCNTAHYWYDALVETTPAPILHIVDAAADALKADGIADGVIGVLSTTGTMCTGIYQNRFAALGYTTLTVDDTVQEAQVMGGIAAIKAGDLDTGRQRLHAAGEMLAGQGCRAIVLGCTEIPIVLTKDMSPAPGVGYLDATDALAAAAVDWHRRVTA